jgi:membrane-associated phospholipid phosphatase
VNFVAALLIMATRASAASPPADDDLSRLPAHLAQDLRQEAAPEGLATLALSGGAFYVVRPNDGGVRSDVLTARPFGHSAASVVTEGGDGLVLFPLSAAFYAGGRLGGAAWAADLGEMSFEALLVSGVEAQILKYSVQRERPDGADHYSFPSGHSSSAFSLATVLAGEYGWEAGVPAYLGACAVGYSRLELDKHWLSDVVFGAGLGIASGRAVVRAKRLRRKKDGLAWAPYFGPGALGVAVAF